MAIYAKAGGCSLEEKALVASTLLDPNSAGYLIADDDRGRKRRKKKRKNDPDDDATDDFLFDANVSDTDEDLGPLWDELLSQVHQTLDS